MKSDERRVYHIWRQMLIRCYLGKNRDYYECSVSDIWHNFYNFLLWHNSNSNGDICLHLDKDIKIKGNKTYSPYTCLLVTRLQNNQTRKNMKPHVFISPEGKDYTTSNRAEFARVMGLRKSSLNDIVSGRSKTHKGWKFKQYL